MYIEQLNSLKMSVMVCYSFQRHPCGPNQIVVGDGGGGSNSSSSSSSSSSTVEPH